MKIHKDLVQGTDEWFAVRAGKMTASHAQAIGNNGKGLETYIYKTMAAYYSSAEVEAYSNRHTERGNELEPQARAIYELENDVTVEEVGFIERDEYCGCSPDGLVGDDGMIEIKCQDDAVYFKLLDQEKVDSKYLWQMEMQLLVSGREWVDFIAYNPNMKQPMLVQRYTSDEKKREKLLAGLEAGSERIKALKKKFKHLER